MPTPAAHTANTRHSRVARLTTDLDYIARHWPALLSPGGSTGRATTQSQSRPPLDTHRLDLAVDITTTLHRWADLIVDERGLTTAPSGTDVPGMATLLTAHATWLAAHPIAPDAAHELTDAARRLRGVIQPTGTRRVPLGACPLPADTTSEEPVWRGANVPSYLPRPRASLDDQTPSCPGIVHAHLHGDGHDDDRDLACDTNPHHTWPNTHARRLATLMGDDTPPRLRTTDLAAWLSRRYGGTVTTAAIRGWHRYHPLSVRPDADGTWDPIEVARWYVGWRGNRATR